MEALPADKVHFRLQTNGTVYRHFRRAMVNLAHHSACMSRSMDERWWEHLASWMGDGHEVVVQLIADPSRLDELEVLYFRALEHVSKEQIYVRFLLGQHGGRKLPQGYSLEELRRIKPLMCIRVAEEELIRISPPNFRGRPCRAGHEMAIIGADGEVFRCTGAMNARQGRLGSLKDCFSLAGAGSPAKCRYPCGCVYQGLWYSHNM